MGERQLRSRSMAIGVEAAPRDPESCHDSKELVCNIAEFETLGNKGSNAQIEVHIDVKKSSHLTIRLTTLRNQMTIL